MQALHDYPALNQFEIFVREDASDKGQTPYDNAFGSGWIVTEDEQTSTFEFDEVC